MRLWRVDSKLSFTNTLLNPENPLPTQPPPSARVWRGYGVGPVWVRCGSGEWDPQVNLFDHLFALVFHMNEKNSPQIPSWPVVSRARWGWGNRAIIPLLSTNGTVRHCHVDRKSTRLN